MTHRHATLAAAAVAIALAATACNGDDDSSDDTTTLSTSSTTDPPPTTEPPTTSSSTTPTTEAATTTTVDIEALKAQIAEDFVRSEEAREQLNHNPTLDNLEARVADVAVPGSPNYQTLLDFVRGMVERGERVVAGDPDYSEVLVEKVELVGDPSEGRAVVTACVITNEVRVDAGGNVIPESAGLYAIRVEQPVERTDRGWLQSGEATVQESREGETACPPSS